MGEKVIEINGLTKKYGNFTAVNQLNLTIEKGQVYGILGPNGSGKTTTLGMILDVINPTSGSYTWFETKPFENHRNNIGAILEQPIFYPDLSAYRNLEISCAIKKAPLERIDLVLERVGLLDRKNSKFSAYSLGMKQRLALASALLGDPDVLVLDEPTNGLDPQGINQMRELIKGIASEGKTIIISSHLLDEIQKTCTHVAILRKGTLLKAGEIGELIKTPTSFEINAISRDALLEGLKNCPFVLSHEERGDHILVVCETNTTGSQLNEYLASKQVYLSHLNKFKISLEEEFLNIVNN
ncbi:ABC transporter ATP-binding protein [Putridiphycobacter roseus]|uniref:ABC transporter ATP-binding protein n=1 Tax=Putridiphycobacter roseus TaxID=2219161 RepID=A0A2W1NJ34_9FLAO|nr:ATP-binding cassette domain-containing protein [Putridiphycobacter roseus]PZE17966.1 ABC transporter ATP-binding protein [Putridiphycobacter roseus]